MNAARKGELSGDGESIATARGLKAPLSNKAEQHTDRRPRVSKRGITK